MIEFNKRDEFEYHIHYSITMACNNRCEYCHVLDLLDNTELHDREMFELVISQIIKFKEEHPEYHFNIFLKGGEPLLVPDKVIEFMDRIGYDNIHWYIFSNFNFKPNGSKITKLVNHAKKHKFSILCSVHESSDHNFVKENIITFKDTVEVHFLLDDNNVDFIYNYAKWLLDTIGIREHHSYVVADIRVYDKAVRKKIAHTDDTDEKVKFILEHADQCDGDVMFGDILYSAQEARELDLKGISSQYFTVCKMNGMNIRYDGTINMNCEYPYRSHIKDGLEIKEVFCDRHRCICSTDQYKKLLRPRGKNAKV